MPAREDMPSTLQRSPEEAQETWAKAHDSAVEEYGHGQRANRTAYSALKHKFEKVGDHWEPKPSKGPSDEAAADPRRNKGSAAGGTNVRGSKNHLYALAQELDIPGRSKMNKQELEQAVQKENRRETARARSS